MHGTNTPTFNSNEFIGEKVGSMKWCDYLEHAEENKEEKEEEAFQDENQSREMEHIINILDVSLQIYIGWRRIGKGDSYRQLRDRTAAELLSAAQIGSDS